VAHPYFEFVCDLQEPTLVNLQKCATRRSKLLQFRWRFKVGKIEALNLLKPEPEGGRWSEPTQAEKWLKGIGFPVLVVLALLAIFYRWPRFAFLLLFPTFVPFSAFFAMGSRSLHKQWMRKVIVEVVSIHCLVLLVAGYLWRTVPMISQRVDWASAVALGIVLVESFVVSSLFHFQRPKE
jgi:hypothetical protein